jgi:hypothetical protein
MSHCTGGNGIIILWTSCLRNPERVVETRIFLRIPPSECWDLQSVRHRAPLGVITFFPAKSPPSIELPPQIQPTASHMMGSTDLRRILFSLLQQRHHLQLEFPAIAPLLSQRAPLVSCFPPLMLDIASKRVGGQLSCSLSLGESLQSKNQRTLPSAQ